MWAAVLCYACSEADLTRTAPQQERPKPKGSIIVKDGSNLPTRAIMNNDMSVVFNDGDKIGLFVMSGTDVILSNVEVTYNGATSEWEPARQITYSSSLAYFAYYPYAPGLSGSEDITPSATAANMFFSNYRRRLCFWSSDQSTLDKLLACDFMVAKGEVTEGNTINEGSILFTMEHQMALFQLELNGRPNVARTARNSRITYTTQNGYQWTNVRQNTLTTDYVTLPASTNFYGNTPCLINGSYLFLAPPGQNTTITTYRDEATSAGTGHWTVTLKAPAGHYVHKQVITDETSFTQDNVEEDRYYTMAIGDILGSDGSIWKTIDASSRGQNAEPVALIFRLSYDHDMFKHGLALGLRDASNSLAWSDNATTTTTSTLSPQWAGEVPPTVIYQYFASANGASFEVGDETVTILTGQNGLANTNAIRAATADDLDRVPVFKALSSYPLTTPANTSGWFIPSASEMVAMMEVLGNMSPDNIQAKTANTTLRNFYFSADMATTIRETLNAKLTGSGSASYDEFVGGGSVQGRYWTSTEFSPATVVTVHFGSNTNSSGTATNGTLRIWASDTFSPKTMIKTSTYEPHARACIAF